MLSPIQRWIIFGVFCLATVGFMSLEASLIWAMIDKGFSGGSTVAAVMNTTVLGGIGFLFKKLVEDTFVKPELLPMGRLHRLATDRSGIIEDGRRSNREVFETRKALVTGTLRFVEETLQGWVPGSHFELCVFVDAKEPLLFSYFDSNHDTVARSMSLREQNAKFYIEKGYEVTKVLSNPTSQPRVVGDTHDTKASYSFTTDEQRKQIRSSVLLSLDLGRPFALVVSSNVKGAFKESDAKLMSFVRYAGELIRSDLLDDGFVDEIRAMKPALFPASVPMIESNAAAKIGA
ncbi:hypothetical protein MesoLj113a_19360 [Mesorhizobium sp. 113-1-2]|uniref:hypothetical protein n=1 Tax=Mesorhizobium sp. 113-1-2 TaxID=2744515 RepID=UPI0008199B1C|nr:hypothetical protein [Mesorhizobium sp. 113-1-2]BAV48093.1 Putative ribosomal-protein-serine acetyltransferase [Mesorhizobium loti]BCG70778.1 hypothetical protein MesoLj113a_19360 [Mesorhizobium sp. 113-1-2]